MGYITEQMLSDAKRNYPVGTTFYAADTGLTEISTAVPWRGGEGDYAYIAAVEPGRGGVVFHHGTWARVISLPVGHEIGVPEVVNNNYELW